MSISEPHKYLHWDDSVESYVDGDLSAEEVSRLEALIDFDVTVAAEVRVAQAIQDSFRSLDPVKCPDSVLTYVLKHARSDMIANAKANAWQAISEYFKPLLRPALAMTVLIAIVLSSVWSGGTNTKIDRTVAEALHDVKWTLAYVSQISKQTGTTVRAAAIEPLVLEQMKNLVETLLDH